MNRYRATVEGWRWDYLSPKGWFPWCGTMTLLTGQGVARMGFYRWREAACVRERPVMMDIARAYFTGHVPEELHEAPARGCVCGVHGIEHLNMDVADSLASLAATRDFWGTEDPDMDWMMSVALSRVTFTKVLPGAWEDRDAAAASHPDAIQDPPDTIRGHTMTYREIMVDREWQTVEFPKALPDWWPPMQYVPDLSEWVRGQCAASVADLLPGGTE